MKKTIIVALMFTVFIGSSEARKQKPPIWWDLSWLGAGILMTQALPHAIGNYKYNAIEIVYGPREPGKVTFTEHFQQGWAGIGYLVNGNGTMSNDCPYGLLDSKLTVTYYIGQLDNYQNSVAVYAENIDVGDVYTGRTVEWHTENVYLDYQPTWGEVTLSEYRLSPTGLEWQTWCTVFGYAIVLGSSINLCLDIWGNGRDAYIYEIFFPRSNVVCGHTVGYRPILSQAYFGGQVYMTF